MKLVDLWDHGEIKTLDDHLEGDEVAKEIAGYQGAYLITSSGRVFSLKQGAPYEMSSWEHATSSSVVELRAPDGTTRILSTEKLRKDSFDSYTTPDSKIYDYIEEVYGDNEEAVAWLETTLEKEIVRRPNRQKGDKND